MTIAPGDLSACESVLVNSSTNANRQHSLCSTTKTALFLFGSRSLINRRKRRALEGSQQEIVASVAEDTEAMLADDVCPDCGKTEWFNEVHVCQWCMALAVQARLLELRQRYPAVAIASG